MSDPTTVTGTAVAEIARLAQEAATVQQLVVGGYIFANRTIHRVDVNPQLPAALEFYTLGAFASYLRAEYGDTGPLVHVVSPLRVDAVSKLTGPDAALRQKPASAVCKSAVLHGFTLNSFAALENLNIALQTCFEPGRGQIEELRRFCAAVRSSATVGVADDGVSQTVEAKRGIAAVQTTAVVNPWSLAPWRTFPEIAQPLSPFVLRFREGEDPEAGLYETGDARWQVEAVQEIARTLRVLLGQDWTVLG